MKTANGFPDFQIPHREIELIGGDPLFLFIFDVFQQVGGADPCWNVLVQRASFCLMILLMCDADSGTWRSADVLKQNIRDMRQKSPKMMGVTSGD